MSDRKSTLVSGQSVTRACKNTVISIGLGPVEGNSRSIFWYSCENNSKMQMMIEYKDVT